MDRHYIILGSTAGGVSGGIIYHRNKLIFMRQKGWYSHILSTEKGKIQVGGLSQFVLGTYPFLKQFPNSFPSSILSQNLNIVVEALLNLKSGELVIESSTEVTAVWGELMAARIQCKHVVVYINESSLCMKPSLASFFKFKFDRKELACISDKHMISIFSNYWNVNENNAVSLSCACSNSLQYCNSIYNDLSFDGNVVGYIGRIDKPFFGQMYQEIENFCLLHSEKSYNLVIFGGSSQKIAIERLEKRCSKIPNLSLVLTGFIYPIPFAATQKIDVFFACAGSSSVAFKTGKPTVDIDSVSYCISGVLKRISPKVHVKCPKGDSYLDYLEWILNDKVKLTIDSYCLDEDTAIINNAFEKHLKFLENSSKELFYYEVDSISMIYYKDYIKRILRFIFKSNLTSLKNPLKKYFLKRN